MAKKNPIARRLETLADQWAEFATNEDARLLRWVLAANEVRMAEAFLAVESDDQAGEYPDLFLTLNTPFTTIAGHGASLCETWVSGYREGKDALLEEGIDADWVPPTMNCDEEDLVFFLRTCRSFIEHYELPRHLAIVLRPTAVRGAEAYQQWLQRLVAEAPPTLRFLVLDDLDRPGYQSLAASDPLRVVSAVPDLGMPRALEEISQEAGGLDTPGGKYRDLFVRMGTALGQQDLATAERLGDEAVAIALAEKWYYATVPPFFALAAGYVAEERFADAIASYERSESRAEEGEREGPADARDACRSLRLQSRLGHGSVLVAAKEWPVAAGHYETAAGLAEEFGDARVRLDCLRLASFCHEQDRQRDEALRVGLLGLEVAREMDEETLTASTFAFLGEGLMRLTKKRRLRKQRDEVERQIIEVAGTEDWRPQAATEASSG
ncbi:MAG: hypothetical protein GY946_23710 [bacterium]|nr:hypothetical protein [bacterium]